MKTKTRAQVSLSGESTQAKAPTPKQSGHTRRSIVKVEIRARSFRWGQKITVREFYLDERTEGVKSEQGGCFTVFYRSSKKMLPTGLAHRENPGMKTRAESGLGGQQ